ncbi:MAG: EthD domain-containing protein [bacterium]|nr:EthD domain-containing protein [bacterium]
MANAETKAQLLICAEPNPGLATRLTGFLAERLGSLPEGERTGRVLVRLLDDPMRSHVTDGRPAYEAVVEFGPLADPSLLIGCLQDTATALYGAVDIDRSAVIAGRTDTIKPGTGDLQLSFVMSRRPDLSAAEFHRYWLDVHAHHARTEFFLGYHQFHGNSELSATLASAAGFPRSDVDGVAECYLESVAGFSADPPTERGDRVNFSDGTTEVGVILRTISNIPWSQ